MEVSDYQEVCCKKIETFSIEKFNKSAMLSIEAYIKEVEKLRSRVHVTEKHISRKKNKID